MIGAVNIYYRYYIRIDVLKLILIKYIFFMSNVALNLKKYVLVYLVLNVALKRNAISVNKLEVIL